MDRRTGSASAFVPALAWCSLLLLSSLLTCFSVLHGTGSLHLLLPPGVCMCVVEEREREVASGGGRVCVWGWMGGETAGMRALNVCVRTATT